MTCFSYCEFADFVFMFLRGGGWLAEGKEFVLSLFVDWTSILLVIWSCKGFPLYWMPGAFGERIKCKEKTFIWSRSYSSIVTRRSQRSPGEGNLNLGWVGSLTNTIKMNLRTLVRGTEIYLGKQRIHVQGKIWAISRVRGALRVWDSFFQMKLGEGGNGKVCEDDVSLVNTRWFMVVWLCPGSLGWCGLRYLISR